MGRFELPNLTALPPQGSVYTNFTTSPKTVSKITNYLLTCQELQNSKKSVQWL